MGPPPCATCGQPGTVPPRSSRWRPSRSDDRSSKALNTDASTCPITSRRSKSDRTGVTMDDELVRRAARGDADAFDALARDRIDRLFAIAIRILRDHHDAEDAVQQALWTAWCDLPGLRDPASIDAWLYRLVVRTSYRTGKSRRRRASVV